MDREKFDQILKDKVQKFEQQYSPVFNEHKIWKGIKKNDIRPTWSVVVAASVIVIIGLSILFKQYNKPVEVVRLKKSPARSDKSFQIPETKPRILDRISNKPEKQIGEGPNLNRKNPEALDNTNQSIIVIAMPDNIRPRADSNQVQTVKIAEPVKVKTIELPLPVNDVETEIKVTFKRGNSVKVMPSAESKLVFKKFKLRIFENQIYDTSAYASGAEVEADRKFRIKF